MRYFTSPCSGGTWKYIEASEGAMTTPCSGKVNVGARGHDAGHLSPLV